MHEIIATHNYTEVVMNIYKKTLFTVFATTMLSLSIPTYADVSNVSLQRTSTINSQKNLRTKKNTNGKLKGRNRGVRRTHFKNPKVGGLRIDACVLGIDWEKSDPQRCDKLRLKKIANEFCVSKGFSRSIKSTIAPHKGRHAVLTYKKSKPMHSFWKKQKGHILIKNIVCK